MGVRELKHLAMTRIFLLVVSLLFWETHYTIASDSSESLPLYQFKVGQELVYQLTSHEDLREEEEHKPASLDEMEWRIFVVQKNDDGSWRLFIRTSITFITTDGTVRAKRDSLGFCDIYPDGTYTLDDKTAVAKRLLPHELFCRLPDNMPELTKGWRYDAPVDGSSYVFDPTRRDGMMLRFTGVVNTAYQQMHQWETTRQYDFDLEQGLVERIVRDFTRLADGKVRNRRIVELTSVETKHPEWISKFHNEATKYLVSYDQWFRLCTDGNLIRDANALETKLQQAKEVLTSARDKATLEVIQGIYDANIEEHEQHAEWALKDCAKRQTFFAEVPKLPTDWKTANLNGSDFRLSDQRGQIVVLDFWGTNCEYCVLVAPQISQLVKEYEGKGVVFRGMFDRRESDDEERTAQEDQKARALINSVYQDIPTLEAAEIVERYQLREFGWGYPLVLILDQEGVIHEMFHGYSSYFPQQGRSIIDRLLSSAADSE